MNLTKTYRDNTRDVKQMNLSKHTTNVEFSSSWNTKGYTYKLSVPISEYLPLSKKALSKLSQISGMEYCVMARHPDSSNWRKL